MKYPSKVSAVCRFSAGRDADLRNSSFQLAVATAWLFVS